MADEKKYTYTDAFTGVEFKSRSARHYEVNDGIPVAPHVDTPRPTVRQRVENLLRRGIDPLANYVGHEGIDMEVPDDPEAPLTASEQNYIDILAADLAEQAPLPDEGLPRTPSEVPLGAPPGAATAPGEGGSPPAAGGPSKTVPT